MRVSIPLLFCLLFAVAAPAAESSADFGPGFEKLAALGMPELPEGTTWSELPGGERSNWRSNLGNSMKGGAWVLPHKEGEPLRFIPFGGITIQEREASSGGSPSGSSSGFLGRLLGGSGSKRNSGSADLEKDIATLLQDLSDTPHEDLRSFLREWNQNGANAFGALLLFATQVHQSGQPALANNLAQSLFNAAPSREAIVDAAINTLAEQTYASSVARLHTEYDWKTFHEDVAGMIERFPRGWKNREAVSILLEPLARRSAGNPPPAPSLPGVGIDPAAVRSVEWMLNPSGSIGAGIPPEVARMLSQIPARHRASYLESIGHSGGGIGDIDLWLLKNFDEPGENASPALPTLKLGMNALPVLAALADDSYLVPLPNPSSGGRSFSYNEDPDPASTYASLDRPATRGDLARLLLIATLPDSRNDLSSADSITLRDIALEFWQRHREASREDLALAILREGSTSQQRAATTFLATSDNPAVHQAIEEFLLSASPLAEQISMVQAYASARKAAAKPFVARYVKALQEETKSNADGESDPFGDPRELDRAIKSLQALVSGQSPQARAIEIARGDPSQAKEAIEDFVHSLSEENPLRAFQALLAGASAAEDSAVRELFLLTSLQIDLSEEGGEDGLRSLSEAETKVWKTLLDDTREASREARTWLMNSTVNETASYVLEHSLSPESWESLSHASIITGEPAPKFSLARAKARIAGEPLPPLPDAGKVPPERLREIVSTVAEKPAAGVHPYLDTLSHDERAAWYQWFRSPDDPPPPANLLELRGVVVSFSPPAHPDAIDPSTLGLAPGFTVSGESLSSLLSLVASNPSGHSRKHLYLVPAAFGPGLAATAIRHPIHDDGFHHVLGQLVSHFSEEDAPADADALAILSLASRHNQSQILCWFKDGEFLSPPEMEPFMSAFRNTIKHPEPFNIRLHILTREDADAISTDNEEE